MAEIGGTNADKSTANLDSTRDNSIISNKPPKEGSLKRHADVDNKTTVKKRRSAEEQANTSKGRNQTIKKRMKEEKKKRKKEKDMQRTRAHMITLRENIVQKLEDLKFREMEDSDKAEEKLVKKEENLRGALIDIEKLLENKGLLIDGDMPENVLKSLSIRIPNWPCLDTYIQDFALDRLYVPENRDKGIQISMSELMGIISKVRSRDPAIGFPTEDEVAMERLLEEVNWKLTDAAHERRYKDMMAGFQEYPGVDPNFIPPPELAVTEENGTRREELKHKLATAIADTESDGSADDINLDDVDEGDTEGDEDELEEKDEEAEGAKEDDDLVVFRQLVGVEENEEEREETRTLMGGGSDEDPTELVHLESMIDKTMDRPDSRGEKDLEEGGTSTNSPTLERDERMVQLEQIEDIKAAVVLITPNDNNEEAMETNAVNDDEPRDDVEELIDVIADTIVLTDGEDANEVQMTPRIEEIVEVEDEIAQPPKPVHRTALEASRSKMAEVQQWVNNCGNWTSTPEVLDVDSDVEKEPEANEDDDIQCLRDDFDWDSVSHSGLPPRQLEQQQRQQQASGNERNERAFSEIPVPVDAPDVVELIELE